MKTVAFIICAAAVGVGVLWAGDYIKVDTEVTQKGASAIEEGKQYGRQKAQEGADALRDKVHEMTAPKPQNPPTK